MVRLFEGSQMNLPNKYAFTTRMVLFTAFFAPAMPFSMIYIIVGFILYYWAEKVESLTY